MRNVYSDQLSPQVTHTLRHLRVHIRYFQQLRFSVRLRQHSSPRAIIHKWMETNIFRTARTNARWNKVLMNFSPLTSAGLGWCFCTLSWFNNGEFDSSMGPRVHKKSIVIYCLSTFVKLFYAQCEVERTLRTWMEFKEINCQLFSFVDIRLTRIYGGSVTQ